MYQLKITRPGSLLSVIVDREIDDAVLERVLLVLEVEDYAAFLERAKAQGWGSPDAPAGAGDDVEAYRG